MGEMIEAALAFFPGTPDVPSNVYYRGKLRQAGFVFKPASMKLVGRHEILIDEATWTITVRQWFDGPSVQREGLG